MIYDFEIVYMRVDTEEFFGKPCTVHSTTRQKLSEIYSEFFRREGSGSITRKLLIAFPLEDDNATSKKVRAKLQQCEEFFADIDFTLVRD